MGRATTFDSRPLPADSRDRVRYTLERAHRREPFAPTKPRAAARRVSAVLASLELPVTTYRGTVGVEGAEVDHVWVAVSGCVVDLCLPLGSSAFRALLRRWVAGDVDNRELIEGAAATAFTDRVLGEFPTVVTYRGAPLWGLREA